jgi:hypothetical protein
MGDILATALGEHVEDEVAEPRIRVRLPRGMRHLELVDQLRQDKAHAAAGRLRHDRFLQDSR